MDLCLLHLTRTDYVVSQWSGGTTTQIAIAPPGAVYGDRDFLWRLSSATVDLDESDFTPLPDYHRLIAPLRGEMILSHDGGAPIVLEPCQVHAFDGGAATHSKGRCVDFNLMLRKGACQGRIYPIRLSAGESWEFSVPRGTEDLLLYCVEGSGRLSAGAEHVSVLAGETARAQKPDGAALVLKSEEAALFFAAEIRQDSKA